MAKKVEKIDLVTVDATRINMSLRAYSYWKKLDDITKTLSGTRGVNFPSEISENLACYALGYKVKKGSGGDAIDDSDADNPRIIEIKGSSAESVTAPNSFSPSEEFDELVFVRLEKDEDLLKIYKTGVDSEELKKIKVNTVETVEDQQRQGRRPRFSIQKEIIDKKHLEPDYIFDLIERKIIDNKNESEKTL